MLWEDKGSVFSHPSHFCTTKSLAGTCRTLVRLKGRRGAAKDIGTQGRTDSESPGCSLCLRYPRRGTEKPAARKCCQVQTQSSHKSWLFPSQRNRKGQPSRAGNVWTKPLQASSSAAEPQALAPGRQGRAEARPALPRLEGGTGLLQR